MHGFRATLHLQAHNIFPYQDPLTMTIGNNEPSEIKSLTLETVCHRDLFQRHDLTTDSQPGASFHFRSMTMNENCRLNQIVGKCFSELSNKRMGHHASSC